MAFKPDPQLVGKSIGSGFGNAKTLLDIVEHRMDRNKLQGIADQMRAGNFEDAGAGLVGIDRIASGLNTMNIPVQRQQIQFRQDDSDRRFQRQGEQFDASQAQQRNLTGQRIAAARENSQRAAQSPTQKAVNSLIQMRDAGLIDDAGYQSRFESLINPPPEYGQLEEGRDSEGNPVFMRLNKRNGQMEPVEGFIPPATKQTGFQLRTTPEGGVLLNQGSGIQENVGDPNIALTKSASSKLQDKIAGQSKTLAAIADIKDAFDPKLMQVPARVQNTITDWASWLGLDPNAGQKDLLERQTNLFQQVHQMFNAYRKEITGAAASVQELASLRKAMIDVDQSPIVFQAALKNFENQAKRGLRINNMLLREGISNNHKDYGRRFDDVNLGGGDDDMDLRYNDLLAKYPNESEEAILDRLIDEGYAGG